MDGTQNLVKSIFLGAVESCPPERWDAYLDEASNAVTGLGGHVLKKLGDGLMALFGYPQAEENDAERAVRAALAMQRALEELVRLFLRLDLQREEALRAGDFGQGDQLADGRIRLGRTADEGAGQCSEGGDGVAQGAAGHADGEAGADHADANRPSPAEDARSPLP